MARKWCRLRSLEPSLLCSSVRDGLVELQNRLSNDPAWFEAEAADKAQRGHSSNVNAYNRVAAWVKPSGRRPIEGRGGDETLIARVWRAVLSKGKSLLPDVGHLVDSLLTRFREPDFMEAEKVAKNQDMEEKLRVKFAEIDTWITDNHCVPEYGSRLTVQ